MSSIKVWLKAARPKTLSFGAAPVLVGTALSLHFGYFSWFTSLLALFGAIFLQIGANYANDVYDFEKGADTADRVGPVRTVASGELSARIMKLGMGVAFALAFLAASPLIWREGWILSLLFLCTVIVAISYSGGPFPLAYAGLGELTNLLFIAGFPTMIMCYLLTHKVMISSFWLGLCFGGLSSSVMCLNNLRDEESDRNAEKQTLVVRFGQRFGKGFYAFLLLYPFVLPIALVYFFALPLSILVVIALLLPCIPLLKGVVSATKPEEFSSLFSKNALLALLYIVTLSYGLIV